MSIAKLASALFFMASTISISHADQQDQNKWEYILGLAAYLESHSADENVKRFVFHEVLNNDARHSFETDPRKGMALLGVKETEFNYRSESERQAANERWVKAQGAMGSAEYMRRYDGKSSARVRGVSVDDIPLLTVTKNLMGFSLGTGVAAGISIAQPEFAWTAPYVRNGVAAGVSRLGSGSYILAPENAPSLSNLSFIQVAEKIYENMNHPATKFFSERNFLNYLNTKEPKRLTLDAGARIPKLESAVNGLQIGANERPATKTKNTKALSNDSTFDPTKIDSDVSKLFKKESEALAAVHEWLISDKAQKKETREFQDDVEYIRAAAGALLLVGRLSKVTPEQQMYIQQAGIVAEAVYKIVKVGTTNPAMMANVYVTLGTVAVDLILGSSQQDPNAPILKGIEQLAAQIEAFRKDVMARFDLVDESIAKGFRDQQSLLLLLQARQLKQSEQLVILSAQMRSSTAKLEDIIRSYFNRILGDQYEACLSISPSGEYSDAKRCGISVLNLATKNKSGAASVTNDFKSLFQDGEIGFIDGRFEQELARATPILARGLVDKDLVIGNPMEWKIGADLWLPLVQKYPTLRNEIFGSKEKLLMAQGNQIQKFYREIFAETYSNGYRTKATSIIRALDNYVRAAGAMLASFADDGRKEQIAWTGAAQALPGEQAQPYRSANFNSFSAIVNNSNSHIQSHINSTFQDGTLIGLTDPRQAATRRIRRCPDIPGPAFQLDWFHYDDALNSDRWITEAFGKDVAKMEDGSNEGFNFDQSFLPLIPREALWLEVMEPTKYRVKACFSEFHTALWGIDDQNAKRYDFTVRVRVSLETPNGELPITYVRTKMQIRIPNLHSLPPQWFTTAFNGMDILGQKIGPMKQNLDKYFYTDDSNIFDVYYGPDQDKMNRPPEKADLNQKIRQVRPRDTELTSLHNNRSVIRELVNQVRTEKIKAFKTSYLKQGNTKAIYDEANSFFRTLTILPAFNYTASPEVNNMVGVLIDSQLIMRPKEIRKLFLSGVDAGKLMSDLNRQAEAIKTKLSRFNGVPLSSKPETPVDEILNAIDFDRRLVGLPPMVSSH